MKKLFCIAAVLLCFLIAAMPAHAEQTQEKELTLMVYMCGSNLQSGPNHFAEMDLAEIQDSGTDPEQINVAVLTGGASMAEWTTLSLHHLEPGGKNALIKSQSNIFIQQNADHLGKNMGDPHTLSNFVRYCIEEYPAKKYALILWDHGGGPLEGVCYDEVFGMDTLSLAELEQALSDIPGGERKALSWIGFDACLMASLETAKVCAPYADYMIASQETEPGHGWNYAFLKDIQKDASGQETAERIIDLYVDHENEKQLLTLSCVDLDAVDDAVTFSEAFFSKLGNRLNSTVFSDYARQRQNVKSFGRATTNSNYDLADLYDLSSQFAADAPEEVAALHEALKQCIVCNESNESNANGLSIYSPYYNKRLFSEHWRKQYSDSALFPAYLNYLNIYADYWLGEQLADWTKLKYGAQPVREITDSQLVEMEMTEDQMKNFSSAKVVILQSTGERNAYKKVFESEPLQPEKSRLEYEYDFQMLYALNGNAKPVTDALSFETVDGYYIMTPILETTTNFAAAGEALESIASDDNAVRQGQVAFPVILRSHRNENEDVLNVDGYAIANTVPIEDMPDESLILTREEETFDTSIFQYLDFEKQNMYRVLEKDQNGKTLPFNLWPKVSYSEQIPGFIGPNGDGMRFSDSTDILLMPLDGSIREFGTVDLREPWSLEFIKSAKSERTGLYAQFIITDTQGNQIASDLIPLNRDNVVSAENLNETLFDDIDKGYSFSFDAIEAMKTDDGTELHFSFTGMFPSQDNCILPVVTSLELDGIKVEAFNLSSKGTQYDTADGDKVVRKYIVVLHNSDLPILKDLNIHQLRLVGDVSSMVNQGDAENPFRSSIQKEYEFDRTVSVDLDLSRVWSLYGKTERDDVSYQLLNLTLTDNQSMSGSLRLKNMSKDQTHTLVWEKKEGELPGVYINDYYIGNAWNGADKVELSPAEEKAIDFEVRLPQLSAREIDGSFFEKWNIQQIESLTLSVQDVNLRYTYYDSETNKYLAGSPDFEKVCFSLNPAFKLLNQTEEVPAPPKALMLEENLSMLIGSLSRYNGILSMDVMVKNSNPYYYLKDYMLYGRESRALDIAIMDCQIDHADCVLRIKPENAGQDPTEWDEYLELCGNEPHSYRSYRLEIARKDGKEIPEVFHDLGIRITYVNPDTNRYAPTSYCFIHIPDSTAASVLSPAQLEIKPSVISAKIDFELPDDFEKYQSRLTVTLPELLAKQLEAENITSMSAYIISQPVKEEGEYSSHYVYAEIPDDSLSNFEGEISFVHPGLLVWPDGAERPMSANLELNGHELKTHLDSFSINGYPLNGHWVDYSYHNMELLSDCSTAETTLNDASGSNSVRTSAQPLSLSYQGDLLTVRDTSEGIVKLTELQREGVDYALSSNQVRFNFLPCTECSPLILYYFRSRDDSISGLIVPYAEAVDDSYNQPWICLCCGSETRGTTCINCGYPRLSWKCADCETVNSILNISGCRTCSLSRADSIIKTAKEYVKEKNYAAALPYLEATVNNGSAYSAEWLSQIYLQGYDVEKDLDLAMKYALIGAELNSSYCYRNLGNIMLEKNNVQEALQYYQTAAGMGDTTAYVKIGDLYRMPSYGIHDDTAALQAYLQAAKADNKAANEWCGYYYYEGIGTERDPEAAILYLKKADELGSGYANLYLGDIYRDDQGDYAQALSAYQRASERGENRAWVRIGDLCMREDYGIRDYPQAIKAYQQALEQASDNQAYINYCLGCLYMKPEYNATDLNCAEKYLLSAYEYDDEYATHAGVLLGQLYLEESFEGRDTEKGIQYFLDAEKYGSIEAEELLSQFTLPGWAQTGDPELFFEPTIRTAANAVPVVKQIELTISPELLEKEGSSLAKLGVMMLGREDNSTDRYIHYGNIVAYDNIYDETTNEYKVVFSFNGMLPAFQNCDYPIMNDQYSFAGKVFFTTMPFLVSRAARDDMLMEMNSLDSDIKAFYDSTTGEGRVYHLDEKRYLGGEGGDFVHTGDGILLIEKTADMTGSFPVTIDELNVNSEYSGDRAEIFMYPAEKFGLLFGIVIQYEDGSGATLLFPYTV